MDKPFPYKICFVEDSSIAAGPIIAGMEVLLGAEVEHFLTTNLALKAMEERGFNAWQVFVLDNRTGYETMAGRELAEKIRSESSEEIVVCLNSSDFEEMRAYGLKRLRDLGIELWKHTESFLMITWLADCAKASRMLSRDEWLESVGETNEYRILNIY